MNKIQDIANFSGSRVLNPHSFL